MAVIGAGQALTRDGYGSTARSDRRKLLADAGLARSKGRLRRAIALHRALLAGDAGDIEATLGLAELLAEVGQSFEAWCLYRSGCRMLLAARRHEECLLTLKFAARTLRYEFEAWRLAAELEQKMGRREAAFQTLLEGRRSFQGRFDRAQAIELLRLARQLEPWDHAAVIDLARLYSQTDQLPRALRLLESLAVHGEGRALAEIRWLQFLVTLSLPRFAAWASAAWRSLRPTANEHPEPLEADRVLGS